MLAAAAFNGFTVRSILLIICDILTQVEWPLGRSTVDSGRLLERFQYGRSADKLSTPARLLERFQDVRLAYTLSTPPSLLERFQQVSGSLPRSQWMPEIDLYLCLGPFEYLTD